MLARQRTITTRVPLGTAAEKKPARLRRAQRELIGGLVLLVPALCILIGLVVYPFFYAIWLSFVEKTVGNVGRFVGFAGAGGGF